MASETYPAVKEGLMQKLKSLYPESKSLDVDREYTTEESFPATPSGINKWMKDKDRTDIKGFDTKINPREPSVGKVMREIGTKYIADVADGNIAPDKFVTEAFEAGRLIKEHQSKIKDFESMKEVIKQAWSKDKGLEGLTKELKDEDYVTIWNHPVIQGYFDKNSRPLLSKYLTLKYHVEPARASVILNKMTPRMKSTLVRKLRNDYVKLIVRRNPPKKSYAKGRWSQEEKVFIRANAHLPADQIASAYLSAFNKRRTEGSIKSQVSRLKKVKNARRRRRG